MARNAGVWGIDIGRCALKAMRCRLDGDVVVADAFDYIEYPKLLTQPDADAPQLVKEALEQFLSRNNVRGDKVALSVPGESGLARYFKPPPVDAKKLADLVKFEAKQQIPFALEDVIWDYQRMPGSQEVDGFVMESEIGLFAMKREQVAKALKPLLEAEVEVDYIQLAPIAVYNFFCHDMTKFTAADGAQYNPDSPPESTVILSIGTETTDLVVTNGFRLWQRNIPLGGNHFTKQLSKELKLTFAKAEHLKRNPRQAEDPKAIFQAMRPVFGDMVTEVQRSIGFFQSLDRKAKITNILMLGNTVKLPGLSQYLGKHLGYEINEIDAYKRLTGASVVTSPNFKDNLLAFGTCYGLCVQGLEKSNLKTNLLPKEVILQRIVKAKKPWAVAGVAAIVLACAINFIFHYLTWEQVHLEHENESVTWQSAISTAQQVSTTSQGYITDDEAKKTQLAKMRSIGNEVVGAADRRVLWLEVMKAINESLPPMAPPGRIPPGQIPDHLQLPFTQRQDLKIDYIETQHFPNLATWFTPTVKRSYIEHHPEVRQAAMAAAADPAQPGAAGQPPATAVTDPTQVAPVPGEFGTTPQGVSSGTDVSSIQIPGPTGPGWVFEIKGYHFYNDISNASSGGSAHVKRTLLKALEHGSVELPSGPGGEKRRFTFKELGIGYSILALDIPINRSFRLENPNYAGPANGGLTEQPGIGDGNLPMDDPKNPQFFTVPKCEFVVQFCWQEKPLNQRLEDQLKALKAADEAARAAAAAGVANPTTPATAPVAPPPMGAVAPPPMGAVAPPPMGAVAPPPMGAVAPPPVGVAPPPPGPMPMPPPG